MVTSRYFRAKFALWKVSLPKENLVCNNDGDRFSLCDTENRLNYKTHKALITTPGQHPVISALGSLSILGGVRARVACAASDHGSMSSPGGGEVVTDLSASAGAQGLQLRHRDGGTMLNGSSSLPPFNECVMKAANDGVPSVFAPTLPCPRGETMLVLHSATRIIHLCRRALSRHATGHTRTSLVCSSVALFCAGSSFNTCGSTTSCVCALVFAVVDDFFSVHYTGSIGAEII